MNKDNVFALLTSALQKETQFFTVRFRRRRDKYEVINGVKTLVAPAGSERTMLCRFGVTKYITGGRHKDLIEALAEDFKNHTLTVFDVNKFHELKKKLDEFEAGRKSYRKINLDDVIEVSLNK